MAIAIADALDYERQRREYMIREEQKRIRDMYEEMRYSPSQPNATVIVTATVPSNKSKLLLLL